MPADELPVVEFAFPGPLRDQLVAAILAGAKTTTTGLVADYEHENEPLPVPGLRQVVVDSADSPVAVIETTAVRVMRLADVDLGHALGEGEGFTSVAEWRAGHEQFSLLVLRLISRPALTTHCRSIKSCTAAGDKLYVAGSISQNTGRALKRAMVPAVAKKV